MDAFTGPDKLVNAPPQPSNAASPTRKIFRLVFFKIFALFLIFADDVELPNAPPEPPNAAPPIPERKDFNNVDAQIYVPNKKKFSSCLFLSFLTFTAE